MYESRFSVFDTPDPNGDAASAAHIDELRKALNCPEQPTYRMETRTVPWGNLDPSADPVSAAQIEELRRRLSERTAGTN